MPFDYDEDEPSMAASVQAGALEALGNDASIQAFQKKLAAAGASAMQPKGSMMGMDSMMDEGGEDYSEVEPEEPEEF